MQRADGNGVDLTYIQQSGDTLYGSDGGDRYTGLDRFGQVSDQFWVKVSGPTTTDRFQYGYDRDGNVLYKNNLLDSTFSELYHANSSASGDNNTAYDNLNRITTFQRGTLSSSGNNGSGLDTVSTLNSNAGSSQSWTLDAVGNTTGSNAVVTDGTSQSRSVDSQNELTSVGGSTLTFDNNGNMTTDKQGNTLVYDAWNRYVAVKTGGVAQLSYAYDANGNQLDFAIPGTTASLQFYVSASGQVLEERSGSSGSVGRQYVWGLGGPNDLILQDGGGTGANYGTSTSGLSQRLYYEHDANNNVTSLVDSSGSVLERYVYTPYGTNTVLTAAWATTTESYANFYTFQTGRGDIRELRRNPGYLIHFGARDYSPSLGRWAEQDPAGYVDGVNRYQFVDDGPTTGLDPTGLYSYGKPVFSGVWWDAQTKTCRIVMTQYQEQSFLDKHTPLGRFSAGPPTKTTWYPANELDQCHCSKAGLAALSPAELAALEQQIAVITGVSLALSEGNEHASDTAVGLGVAAASAVVGGVVDAAGSGGTGPKETFANPADAIGDINGQAKKVGQGVTKSDYWNGHGYTETHYHRDSNGVKNTVFYNPKTKLFSGARVSSGQ